jgi:hypothetical protein
MLKDEKLIFIGTTEDDGVITHDLARKYLKIGRSYKIYPYSQECCKVKVYGRYIFLPISSFILDVGKKYGLK